MAEIWRTDEDGRHVYIPTNDGKFEEWMDANSDWDVAGGGQIEMWREIWEAARLKYEEVVKL